MQSAFHSIEIASFTLHQWQNAEYPCQFKQIQINDRRRIDRDDDKGDAGFLGPIQTGRPKAATPRTEIRGVHPPIAPQGLLFPQSARASFNFG